MILTERQFTSEMRQQHLIHAAETWNTDINTILKYEEKFHRIQYIPLDSALDSIPEEFANFFFENSTVNSSHFEDYDKLYYGMYKKHTTDFNTKHSIPNKELSSFDLHDIHTEMMKSITEGLPFDKINSYTILSNNKPVPKHRDYYYYLSLPISFRVVLYNENTVNTQTFYDYIPTNEKLEKDKFIDFDSEVWDNGYTGRTAVYDWNSSPFFTYNNLTIKHGADKIADKRKIVMVVKMTNVINWDKFDDLIQRSAKRFKNDGFFTDKPLEEYVDL